MFCIVILFKSFNHYGCLYLDVQYTYMYLDVHGIHTCSTIHSCSTIIRPAKSYFVSHLRFQFLPFSGDNPFA